MGIRSRLKWVFPPEVNVPADFLAGSGYVDFVRRAVWSRGIKSTEKALKFLNWKRYKPTSPSELPDMDKAVERILHAIRSGQSIGVWGDFDVDGQTSTSVLVSAFRMLDVPCQYHIPVRATESHGIKLEPLKQFISRGIDLLITCDTGIAESKSIDYAQSNGVDVIVTDHHVLPEILPNAFAVINPRRLEENHPLQPLAGVGTAYKLAEALLTEFRLGDQVKSLHDLVALGSVADQAYLVEENRFMVQSGIDQLRSTPRPALRSLLDFSEVSALQVTESQLGFLIAPRLNALGRLADANPAVEFLLSDNPSQIEEMTLRLEELNSERKIQCDQVLTGAMSMIQKDRSIADQPAIILTHPEWPAGVIGITASRLVDLFQKPVIIMTKGDRGILKGSARSIEGVDISAVIRQNGAYLNSFGGHPMAAGLSLHEDQFPRFFQAIQSSVRQVVENLQISGELKSRPLRSFEYPDPGTSQEFGVALAFWPRKPRTGLL